VAATAFRHKDKIATIKAAIVRELCVNWSTYGGQEAAQLTELEGGYAAVEEELDDTYLTPADSGFRTYR
jgi:hypothetical protein